MAETAREAARRLSAPWIAKGYQPRALHEYREANGNAIYWRIRLEHPDGDAAPEGRKIIRPMHLNGAGFALGEPKFPDRKPLYGLDCIAAHPDTIVWIVEGEKAADALRKLGAVAITSGGADSAGRADWTSLRGRKCVVWPDNDDAGRSYAGDVAAILLSFDCAVSVVDIGSLDLPTKGDAVDWIAARDNATLADLDALPRIDAHSNEPSATAVDRDEREWPEPRSLPDGLLPVAAFDMELLPLTLRPWIADISDRVQCAPDFVAVATITALGAVIGRKVAIRPQARTDWTEVPNFWALVVGRPGVLKSPAIEQALVPFRRLEARANEAHAEAIRRHQAMKLMRELRDKENKKQAEKALKGNPEADLSQFVRTDDEDEPICRRYSTNDTSAASLGELHRLNPNGLLVHRDEMVSLLRDLEHEENASARGFYLTGWNGNSAYTIDRIGRGLNLRIPAVCLSLLGGTQPGRIAGYVKAAVQGGERDDGLIQRFGMLVWPEVGGTWRDVDRWPDNEAKRAAFDVFDKIDALDAISVGAQQDTDYDGQPSGVPYLRYADDARELFLEWRAELEAKVRSGDLPPALESHLAKYRKLVPTLALLLHLADEGFGPVTGESMLQALAWAEYLESHARRTYASGVSVEVAAAKAILARIRKGDLPREFSRRDVWRPGWAGLAGRDSVAAALDLLVDYAWLDCDRQETRGRTATRYTVNPRTLR